MSYQALYRAWRPPSFADMVHQPHVKQTLQNAILRQQVAHAYLFCGPRGTGKTSAAKILAKAVNCLSPNGADPCNECAACAGINDGSSVDVEEIDAASNRGVEEIRQLRDKVQYAPASLSRKVYIVDEVHMLTPEAFNALLKTLEEPPRHVLFILATTEPHRLPETIISRCQRFDFRRIPDDVMVERLRKICGAEGWTADEDALWHIAAAADGGLRDALGLLEQTAAFGGGSITAENSAHVVGGVPAADLAALVQELVQGNPAQALGRIASWHALGKDTGRIVAELLHLLRDLFIVKLTPGDANAGLVAARFSAIAAVVPAVEITWIVRAVKELGELYTQLRYLEHPRIAVEACLVGLSQIPAIPVDHTNVSPENAAQVSQRPVVNESSQTTTPAAEATSPTQSPEPKVPRGNSMQRKLEVLQSLAQAATETGLSQVQEQWENLLDRVKAEKIQTYAWLSEGKPVLTTPEVVLVAFGIQIHRDNVMKPHERAMIEAALAEILGRPLRFQAILRGDWEAYLASQSQAPAPSNESEDGWVNDVVQMFGPDKVQIKTEE